MNLNKYKTSTIILSTFLIILVYFSLIQNLELNDLRTNITRLNEQLNTTQTELRDLRWYFNKSIFGVGKSIRKHLQLQLVRLNTSFPPIDVGPFRTVIYVYEDESTLFMDVIMNAYPGIGIPFTIQKGDYSMPEYANQTSEDGSGVKYAPVVWSANVNQSSSYSIQLDEGWYTISLTSRWSTTGGTMVPGLIWENSQVVEVLPISVWMDVHVSHGDELWNPFLVNDLKTR